LDKKLEKAISAYEQGFTCSQAVFCACAKEMGIDPLTAQRLMEGFGGGLGGLQEVCGAFSAACAIISYRTSDGSPGPGKQRRETGHRIREAAEIFRQKHGGITCRDILHGELPKARQCVTKVKDAILLVEKVAPSVPVASGTTAKENANDDHTKEYMKQP
jgi:C_GCAxxG_C_C family probable redox protein